MVNRESGAHADRSFWGYQRELQLLHRLIAWVSMTSVDKTCTSAALRWSVTLYLYAAALSELKSTSALFTALLSIRKDYSKCIWFLVFLACLLRIKVNAYLFCPQYTCSWLLRPDLFHIRGIEVVESGCKRLQQSSQSWPITRAHPPEGWPGELERMGSQTWDLCGTCDPHVICL